MPRKRSIKDLKAQLDASKKALQDVNHPQRKKNKLTSVHLLNRAKRKKAKKEYDQAEEDYQNAQKEIDNSSLTEEEKIEEKNKLRTSWRQSLAKNSKQLKKKIKKKKKSKASHILAFIFFPIIFLFVIIFLAIWMAIITNINGAVGTIAGLIDPKQQAIMKAQGVLQENKVTEIPQKLVGALEQFGDTGSIAFNGNGSGSSSESGSNSKNNSKGDSNVKIAGNEKSLSGRIQFITTYLHKHTSFTPAQIAAIIGNWSIESGINPIMTEAHSSYTEAQLQKVWNDVFRTKTPGVDGGDGGMGLGQWTGSRAYLFMKAAGYDKDKAASLDFQLSFFMKENAEGIFTQGKNWSGWGTTTDPTTASNNFLTQWEGINNGTEGERASEARKWYSQIQKWYNNDN